MSQYLIRAFFHICFKKDMVSIPGTFVSSPRMPLSGLTSTAIMSTVTLTNSDHLINLEKLGAIWNNPVSVRATISPTSQTPGNQKRATLTFSALKRHHFQNFPSHNPTNEWSKEYYDSSDPACQLWTGFYHMMEERDETRIFGPYYTDETTTISKLRAFFANFKQGKPVHVYLSSLGIADEFGCDGAPDNVISNGMDQLRRLANAITPPMDEFCESIEAEGAQHDYIVSVYGTDVVVNTHGSEHKVKFPEDDGEEEGEDIGGVAREAAELVMKASVQATGYDMGQQVNALKNVYVWDYPVSDVKRVAGEGKEAAIERYARVAGAALKCAAERTKDVLKELGVTEEDMLRYVSEYVGKQEGVYFAAVESVGGVQKGVKDISYSAFEEEREGAGDSVSVAATVECLRNTGRLGFANNLVEAGPAGEKVGRRIIVEASEGTGLLTVPEAEGKLVDGALEENAFVC